MKKEYSDDEEFIHKWDRASPKDRYIIVVDEFGNASYGTPLNKHETKFGFGVSNVIYPNDYAKISRNNRKKHDNDEQKAGKSSLKERKEVSTAIRKTKTKTACVYVDKRKEMPEYMKSKKYERILGLLNDTLDETLPKSGVVWVVIDHNTQYRGNAKIKRICSVLSNEKRTIYGRQYDSEGVDLPSDLLQTNDYVANAARSKVELKDGTRAKILKMRFKRIMRK